MAKPAVKVHKPVTKYLTKKQWAKFLPKHRVAANLHAIATALYKAMPNGARAKVKLVILVGMPAEKGGRRG